GRRARVRRGGRPRERRLDVLRSRGTVARSPRRSAGSDDQHRTVRAAHRRVRRWQQPHLGAELRFRCGRRLPALPGARRTRLGRPGRSSVHGCVDRRRVGALNKSRLWRLWRLLLLERSLMKRMLSIIGTVMGLATPAAAQWLGMPAWNSTNGCTGYMLYCDYSGPHDSSVSRDVL